MKIGESLKYYRQLGNKKQGDFCKNVISVSFYSKVENNESRISAEDLLLLLEKNEIPLEDFFLPMKKNRKIIEDIYLYYYQGDTEQLKRIYERLSKSSSQKFNAHITKFFLAIRLNELETLSKMEIDYLKSELFRHENWDKVKLSLLTNILHLFDEESAELLVNQVIKKVDLSRESRAIQTIVYSLILNYISFLFKNQQNEKIKKYLAYIKQIQTIPENLFQTMLRDYYEQLLNENKQKDYYTLKEIEEQFCYYGLKAIGEPLREIRENNE